MAPGHVTKSFNAALESLLLDLHHRRGPRSTAAAPLRVMWGAAVGAYLAKHTTPLGLSDGTLRIGASSSQIVDEILRLQLELIERLNRHEQLKITGIRVDLMLPFQVPAALQPASEQANTSQDPPLPEDLPPVREELRPILHRLLALDRQRRQAP